MTIMKLKIYGLALLMTLSGVVHAEILKWEIRPSALVTHDVPPLQNIDMDILTTELQSKSRLKVWVGDQLLAEKELGRLHAGTNRVQVLMPEPEKTVKSRWELLDDSQTVAEQSVLWNPPRHWQLYVIKSSHVDIGLHDSQFKQRYLANGCIDDAVKLAAQASDSPEASRFRYVIEGLWWWLNYPQDRSEVLANEIVQKYCRSGLFGIGASHSGNRSEVLSTEELCRSTYGVQQVRERWNLPMDTMMMVDNNGLTWPLVTAYADAGIKYAGLFSNAWNPGITKAVLGWGKDASRDHFGVGGDGGGSRIDVGWDSDLPHLFYWQGADAKSRLLIWTCPTYTSGGYEFGLSDKDPKIAEKKMVMQFAKLEQRYPYDLWLLPFYSDNEIPNLAIPSFAEKWNKRWRWPEIRTVGDLSVPFRLVESRFGDKIPVLSGMITAGWAQHPASTPSVLAAKREVDRLLPVAEKLATVARLTDPGFVYPTLAFRRAWDALICNDEHGYGVSSYTGRKVFDTWMQKSDWINRAYDTAETESSRALKSLAAQVTSDGLAVLVFNPTLQPRTGRVEVELPESASAFHVIRTPEGSLTAGVVHGGKLNFVTSEIPSMGYARFELLKGEGAVVTKLPSREPPVLENSFYRVTFAADGSITAIFDKQLQRELVDAKAPYRCNQLVYSRDSNKTFVTPSAALFEVEKSALETTVTVTLDDAATGAEIVQRVTLPAHEKQIDIDNRLNHVIDLADGKRYNSFGYYAFPFDVPHGEFRVGLNGCSADALKDQTGHGTDTYHAARDWSYVGNGEFGVSLVQLDSMLIECGRIHEKKNVIGEKPISSHLYSYLFNDWLFSHAYVTGPSYINLRYRYVIVSHAGSFSESGVERLAERVCTPLLATVIARAQKGTLPSASSSFLSVDVPRVSLLALKLSEKPGAGVIARFHENEGVAVDRMNVRIGWGSDLRLTRCSVAEQDRNVLDHSGLNLSPFGYATLRIEQQGALLAAPKVSVAEQPGQSVDLSWEPVKDAVQYNVYRGEYAGFSADAYHLLTITGDPRFSDTGVKAGSAYYYRVAAVAASLSQGELSQEIKGSTPSQRESPPRKVGSRYTGLISDPRAWRGTESDLLYLQWGQNQETDLSHYELYRGDTPDFEVCEKTFVAKVEPGPYVVVPFEDRGLKPHTAYFYRVLAVDRDGRKSEPSELCKGITHEPFKPPEDSGGTL